MPTVFGNGRPLVGFADYSFDTRGFEAGVDTIVEARAVTDHNDNDLLFVEEVEGVFYYSDVSTATDDGTTVLKPDDVTGAGRWLLLPSGGGASPVQGEPTGFPTIATSHISFNNTTHKFKIEPKAPATSFVFYYRGRKITKYAAEEVELLPLAVGRWYIYYDSNGVLQASQTEWDFGSVVFVATISWDGTVGVLGEERHGLTMDWATHQYLHDSLGIAYWNGLAISGYTLQTDTDPAVQFGLTGGQVADEDLIHTIVSSAIPAEFFEQNLADPAQIPVFYRQGPTGQWSYDAPTNFAFKNTAAGRVNYNRWDGVNWVQQEATDNHYVAYWLVATNLVNAPIVSIQGQRQDENLAAARAQNRLDSFDVGDLFVAEKKVLYRLIFQTSTSFGGTRKVKLVDLDDYRPILGQLGVVGDEPNPDIGPVYGINKSFYASNKDFAEFSLAVYETIQTFIFRGTGVHTPTELEIVGSRLGATGVAELRIRDVENGNDLATISWTSTTKARYLTESVSNLPLLSAMCEVQVRTSGSKSYIHYVAFR